MKILVVGTGGKGGINEVIRNHESSNVFDGYEYFRLISHVDSSRFKKIQTFLQSIFQAIRVMSVEQTTVLYLHGAMKGSVYRKYIFALLGKLFGAKIIYHIHGSEYSKQYIDGSKLYQWVVRRLIDWSDRVVVLSEYLLPFLSSICCENSKVRIIRNFPDDKFDLLSNRGELFQVDRMKFLFMGYVGDRKGIFDILSSLELLLHKGESRFEFIVAGNGELEKLESQVERRGLKSHVNILGWIDNEKKIYWLSNCDVLVLPSYNEGVPIAILEAFASGLAVISSPVGGIPDVIDHGSNGLICEPGDAVAIAEMMRLLISNHEIRKGLVARAHEVYLSKYSSGVVRLELIDLLNELVVE